MSKHGGKTVTIGLLHTDRWGHTHYLQVDDEHRTTIANADVTEVIVNQKIFGKDYIGKDAPDRIKITLEW